MVTLRPDGRAEDGLRPLEVTPHWLRNPAGSVLFAMGNTKVLCTATLEEVRLKMDKWIESNASDGFTIMFPYLPGGLDDFVRGVIPELQRRGIFRKEYEGKTLRDNLGLPRPGNRFFDNKAVAAD